MPGFGPETARIEVLVFREGVLAAVAHDLVLAATAFHVSVDEDGRAVRAEVDAGSLRVVSALRDGRPLPDALRPADRREIEATVAREVLRAARHPTIAFRSTGVAAVDAGYEVRGQLTIAGATRDVAVGVVRDSDRLRAEIRVHQPDHGIQPYRAMLGALRVKPDVLVRVSVPAGPLLATARAGGVGQDG